MRNREVIEREMNRAREDLETSVSELRHVVQEKFDVKARARVAVEKGKQKAEDVVARTMLGAQNAYAKSRETVEERPVLVGSIVVGALALGAFIFIARRNNWFRSS